MKTPEQDKLLNSIKELENAMRFADKIVEDKFYFSGISKCYEVCLGYAWKFFKKRAIDEGLEIYSPKDAVKAAGRLKLIDNVEKWLDFIEDRNLAVHDYLGVSNEDYLNTIRAFLIEVKRISKI